MRRERIWRKFKKRNRVCEPIFADPFRLPRVTLIGDIVARDLRVTVARPSVGWLLSVLCFGAACTGEVGSTDSASPSTPTMSPPAGTVPDAAPTTPGMAPPSPSNPLGPAPGALPYAPPAPAAAELPARVWLLTPEEYGRAVRSVIGKGIDVSDIDPIPDTGVYPNMSRSGVVRVALARQLSEKAALAVDALTTAELTALVPCGSLERSCRDDFVARIVSRAFRRPATDEDKARYTELFELGAEAELELGFRSVIRGLLTSPHFLYRTEVGATADAHSPAVSLTSHELGSLLSFSVTGAPPSAALLAAADRGELAEPAKLREHLQALMAEPAASERIASFLVQWLRLHRFEDEVEKFEDVFPGFAAAKAAIFAETTEFLGAYGTMKGTLSGLLTSPVPSTNAELSAFYRGEPSMPASGSRIGLLSLGAVLSKNAKQYLTSPTLRGLFVRDQLLCQHISLPENFTPPPIEVAEAQVAPKTTRELYELHAKEAACAGCHSLLDSVGFLFEGFDGAGRMRTTETYRSPTFTNTAPAPRPIDSTGELLGTDVDGKLGSVADLAQALAKSNWVRECVARQAFRFYFGEVESERGIPPVAAGTAALQGSGALGDLVQALFTTESTTRRVR